MSGDPVTPFVLAAAGALGAFANAATSKEHPTLSQESIRQTIIGFVMGGLWQVKIGDVWPVVYLEDLSIVANGFLVFTFAYAAADLIGTRVIGWIRTLAGSKGDSK